MKENRILLPNVWQYHIVVVYHFDTYGTMHDEFDVETRKNYTHIKESFAEFLRFKLYEFYCAYPDFLYISVFDSMSYLDE